MATTKITELTAATTIANTDILVVVTDPSGSPTTKKITANNLVNSLANATLRQLPYANSSSNGTIKVGTNLTVNATGHLSVNSDISVNAITATSKIQVGNAAGFAFNNSLIEIDGSTNSYLQSVIQNANSGTNASGDLVITADTGNDTVDYVDFGINSSTYNNPDYNIGGGGDGYIYASNGNFTVGVLGAAKELKLHAGSANTQSIKLTINASSVYVNTSTDFKVGTTFIANSTTLTIGNSTVNTTFSATGTTYVANSSNWTGSPPSTIEDAIDRIAAVVKSLNGGTGA